MTNLSDQESLTLGFYIKTFDLDYDLTRALLASIEHFCPGIPIVLIPGDEYDATTLLGYPTMTSKDPMLLRLRGYFKKLWTFFGPLDRFIYIDSDTILLRHIPDLIEELETAIKPFIIVCNESKMITPYGAYMEQHLPYYRSMLGDLELMDELDSSYDFRGKYPFPSGFFMSHRGAISASMLQATFERAQDIHKNYGLPPLNNSRDGLFNGDQGLINYLIYKEEVWPRFLEDVFVYGKSSNEFIIKNGYDPMRPFANAMVTWPGYPRPSVLRRNLAGADLWNGFYRKYFERNNGLLDYRLASIRNAKYDLVSRFRRAASAIKSKLL